MRRPQFPVLWKNVLERWRTGVSYVVSITFSFFFLPVSNIAADPEVLMCSSTGLDIDGLYRVSGNLAVIQKLRYKADHGKVGQFSNLSKSPQGRSSPEGRPASAAAQFIQQRPLLCF